MNPVQIAKAVGVLFTFWIKALGPKLFWALFAAASVAAVVLNRYV